VDACLTYKAKEYQVAVPSWHGIARRRRGGVPPRLLVAVAALALLLGACGTDEAGETTTTAAPSTTVAPETTTTAAPTTTAVPEPTTTTEAEPTGMAVYFMLEQLEGQDPPGPFLVPVYRDSIGAESAMTAMELLLAGPTSDESAGTPAVSTAIPEGTEVLGVEAADGVATVDMSDEFDDGGGSFSMFARLAQVVYTLTRLPDIDAVAFEIEGEPVTVFSSEGIELDGPQQRDDYYDLLHPIFVDHPAWGEPVTSPIQVVGLSNVFEAVSQVLLTDDDGEPLFEETVMASCGTGCWGEWSIEIPYEVDREQFGALIVWEFSAQDGSRVHIREYPVQLR
jgi:germination protein M